MASSISTIVSSFLLALTGRDADKTSTSVNCALPKTSWSSPSTSISSSTSSWFVSLTWKPEAAKQRDRHQDNRHGLDGPNLLG